MNVSLAAFQDHFIDAIRGDGAPASALSAQAGFAVYRNTWMKACVDALEANFPAVACLVGRDWFRSVAALYASGSMPLDGRLIGYGENFADFLETIEAASDIPYLADVARLDWLLLASSHATDAPTLEPDTLLNMSARDLGRCELHLHPSVRWQSSAFPSRSIWEASRVGHAVQGDLHWTGEATLIVRRTDRVHTTAIDQATCDLLQAIQAGHALGASMNVARHSHHAARLDMALVQLITTGAFTNATLPPSAKDLP
ncbi:DNA-binding domain-containing protein [Pinirhizobacter sp.]|uniref:DNA-binding domain-containing protein n=1 Tax=Pinirhizobacter sp. TaxID=2950432 RepID=UPI002F40C7F2